MSFRILGISGHSSCWNSNLQGFSSNVYTEIGEQQQVEKVVEWGSSAFWKPILVLFPVLEGDRFSPEVLEEMPLLRES